MYKCDNCGHLFDDGEQAVWAEDRGECWGTRCSETVSGCPICKCDYEEVFRCKICGDWHKECELMGGLCDDCLDAKMDYRSILDFLIDTDYLRDFLTEIVWEKTDMVAMFYFKQAEDTFGNKSFLKSCKSLIKSGDYEITKSDFAEWLNKKEVK